MSRTWGLLTILLSLRCETDSSSVKWMSPRWMMAASIENNCDTSFKKGWTVEHNFPVRQKCYMKELNTWNDCTAQNYSPPSIKVWTYIKRRLIGLREGLHLSSLYFMCKFYSPRDWSQWCQSIFEPLQTCVCFQECIPSLEGFALLFGGSWKRDERQSACHFFSIACQKLSGIP